MSQLLCFGTVFEIFQPWPIPDLISREEIPKICKEGGFEASAATHPCPVKPVSALAGSEPAPRGHDEGSGGFESFEAWAENLPNSRLQRSDWRRELALEED